MNKLPISECYFPVQTFTWLSEFTIKLNKPKLTTEEKNYHVLCH